MNSPRGQCAAQAVNVQGTWAAAILGAVAIADHAALAGRRGLRSIGNPLAAV